MPHNFAEPIFICNLLHINIKTQHCNFRNHLLQIRKDILEEIIFFESITTTFILHIPYKYIRNMQKVIPDC